MQDYQLYEDFFGFLLQSKPSLLRTRQLAGLTTVEKVNLVKEVAIKDPNWFIECLSEVCIEKGITSCVLSNKPVEQQKLYVHLYNFMSPLLSNFFEEYLDEFHPARSFSERDEWRQSDNFMRVCEIAQSLGFRYV